MAIKLAAGFEPPEPHDQTRIWRYLDVAKFESLLQESAMYFASAREFQDKFEGSISVPDAIVRHSVAGKFSPDSEFIDKQLSGAFEQLRRLHKISCWHVNPGESAAMWQLYLREGRGIAIQSNIARLLKSLHPYRIRPTYGEEDLVVGIVRYADYRTVSLEGEGFLRPFFHKRLSYSYEQELRVVVSLREAEEFGVSVPEKGIFVKVDLPTLIETVYLAPGTSDQGRKQIDALMTQHKIHVPLHQSELDDAALY